LIRIHSIHRSGSTVQLNRNIQLTLLPGDIILTGTPAGVGFAMNPPQFLKRGDIIEAEIESLGILQNTIE